MEVCWPIFSQGAQETSIYESLKGRSSNLLQPSKGATDFNGVLSLRSGPL